MVFGYATFQAQNCRHSPWLQLSLASYEWQCLWELSQVHRSFFFLQLSVFVMLCWQ